MPSKIITVSENYGDELRPGMLTGVHAQIAADPKVHEYWPMTRNLVSGISPSSALSDQFFSVRPAKSRSKSMVLRPAEMGYRPQWSAIGNVGFLRFGFGANGGPSGGSLTDTNNGALMTGPDARVFPVQVSQVPAYQPYTIIAVARAPASSADGKYPGAIVGSATIFPDHATESQTNWAGLGIGYGSSFFNRAFFAARGTNNLATEATDRATNTWFVFTGIFDVANELYRLRVNGTEVDTSAFVSSAIKSTEFTGYLSLRVGSAGYPGKIPLERTWVGDIGSIAIMHVAGNAAEHIDSLVRIENAMMDEFSI